MRYTIGLRSYHYEDATRRSWLGPGPRPLLTDVWYPAIPEAVEREVVIGSDELPLYTAGRAARNAPPLDGRFPLILLSHGSGGSGMQLGWLASALARSGYIAAALNHHGNTALDPVTPEGLLYWWERTRDLSAVIDRLAADELFGPRIDRARIGAAGFSLGGYTVIALSGGTIDLGFVRRVYRNDARKLLRDIYQEVPKMPRLEALVAELLEEGTHDGESFADERVRCSFVIAPTLGFAFTPEGLGGISIPVKIVVGEADTITPADRNAARYAELIPGAELTLLDGHAAHFTFLGEGTVFGRRSHPELFCDPAGADRGAAHRTVASMAEGFFGHHLAPARAAVPLS